MNEQKSKSESKTKLNSYRIFCILLTLLAPGLGYILWGYEMIGLAVLVGGLLLTIGITYAAVFGGGVIVASFIFSLIVYIVLIYSFFKLERKPLKKVFLFVGLALVVASNLYDFRRVEMLTVPSEAMAPALLKGDSVAIDKSQTVIRQIKEGDIVAVKLPNRPGIYIRKVQSSIGQMIAVMANDPQIPAETVAFEDVIGKALYVFYSYDSFKKEIRWDRFLKPRL